MRPQIQKVLNNVHIASLITLLLLAGTLVAGAFVLADRFESQSPPDVVVKQYVANVYARDYNRAYDLLSTRDRAVKTRDEYVQQSGSFAGPTLELARRLASYIEYTDVRVENLGDRASVTVAMHVPDGNAPQIRDILYADPQAFTPWQDNLSDAKQRALTGQLERLKENGHLPTLEGEHTFQLVKEENGWKIFENWAGGVRVHFSGAAKHDLPWLFEPARETVLAEPGEILHARYRAKNLSNQPLTAKARHIDTPVQYSEHLEIFQCFCFIQQTLQPNEEIELSLAFRIAPDLPADVTDFYVRYEFYPIETFPDE